MLTAEELATLEKQKGDFDLKIKEKEKEKEALYQSNKDNVDIRNAKQKQASTFGTFAILAIIVSAIGLLIIKSDIIFLAGLALFVLFLILKAKPKKQAKKLTADLTDYDNQVSAIDKDIQGIRREAAAVSEKISRHYTEKRYEQYSKNHICIYAGQSTSPGITGGKPRETASSYDSIEQLIVYIDGIEYGDISKPFGSFEVSPGPHVVKIECYTRVGGKNGVIRKAESKAKQVSTASGSVFMFYHWNFYFDDKGLHDNLYLNIFDNVYDLLVATHQH